MSTVVVRRHHASRPSAPLRLAALGATLLALALSPSAARAAHFTVDDSIEGQIELRHDANWELGVVSNGVSFPSRTAGSTVVPGETATFSGGWYCNTPGSPDPGEGVIYVVDPAAPDRVKAIISALWTTDVLPGLDEASIQIGVQSSPTCDDLGPLPAAFAGLGLVAVPGPQGIAGAFRDPVTAAPARIPSNLGMTLRAAVGATGPTVPVDIKPRSCPNPLNVGSLGVLPVALLGTPDFDVTTVDPASVTLEGVPALRWDLDDVATPYGDGGCLLDCRDCHREGADGELDLSLKFDRPAIVAALGAYEDGECRVLRLEATLLDGTVVTGGDVVWIKVGGR